MAEHIHEEFPEWLKCYKLTDTHWGIDTEVDITGGRAVKIMAAYLEQHAPAAIHSRVAHLMEFRRKQWQVLRRGQGAAGIPRGRRLQPRHIVTPRNFETLASRYNLEEYSVKGDPEALRFWNSPRTHYLSKDPVAGEINVFAPDNTAAVDFILKVLDKPRHVKTLKKALVEKKLVPGAKAAADLLEHMRRIGLISAEE